MNNIIILNQDFFSIFYDTTLEKYSDGDISHEEFMRYIVGKFSNLERFISRAWEPKVEIVKSALRKKDITTEDYEVVMKFWNRLKEDFNSYSPFSFKEAWSIQHQELQNLVFDTIDIEDVLKNLESEKYKVDGIKLKNKIYSKDGKEYDVLEQHNVYEVYKCKGEKLGLEDAFVYALKMWCTTTNKVHYIWIDETHKDSPLEAISGTFQIHRNVWEKTKCIKRQGDILVVELTEEVEPEGELFNLSAKQYFGKLVSQS